MLLTSNSFLSIVNQLRFEDVEYGSNKLIEMTKGLLDEFSCDDVELKKAFENVHFWLFDVDEVNCLKFAKFLASVYLIQLNGRRATITTTVKCIFNAISECWDLGRVRIWDCKLEDEDLKEEIIEFPKNGRVDDKGLLC